MDDTDIGEKNWVAYKYFLDGSDLGNLPVNGGTYKAVAYFAGNDTLTICESDSATVTVSKVSITCTATGGSSTYGDSPTNPGFTATGLVNNETASVLTGLSNDFNVTVTTPAGPYTLNVTGTLINTNYNITQRNTGAWTVDPKGIAVTATGGSSTYGDSPTNPGFTAAGLVNGETESVLTGLSNDFNVIATTPAGPYTLNVTGDLTNGNYNITQRNTGLWTVNKAPLVIHYHTLTITTGEGIVIDKDKNTFEIESGNPFSFVITLAEGYEGQTPTLIVNGRAEGLIPLGIDKWRCIIAEIFEDTNVTVSFNPTANDTSDASRIYSRGSQLIIETPVASRLIVYKVTGQVLVSRQIADGMTAIPLPTGIYIIRLAETTTKVVVGKN